MIKEKKLHCVCCRSETRHEQGETLTLKRVLVLGAAGLLVWGQWGDGKALLGLGFFLVLGCEVWDALRPWVCRGCGNQVGVDRDEAVRKGCLVAGGVALLLGVIRAFF